MDPDVITQGMGEAAPAAEKAAFESMNPAAGSSLTEKAGGVLDKVTDFATKHPYLTGTALQVLGAWLADDPNEQQAQQSYFGITPEGKIQNPNGEMVPYRHSVYASPEYKAHDVRLTEEGRQAQTPAVAQTEVPQDMGLIDAGESVQMAAPAQVVAANPDLLNRGLIGGVKVKGT